jgi:outer membrane protein assembly factor BamE
VTGIPGLHAYKIDIQQGNYVTQDMVAKLKPGMTKSQVKFALGTPLVTDVFHPERWDYVYVLNKKGKLIEQRRIIVVFQDDKLLRLEGDVVPAREAESSPTEKSAATKLPEKAPDSKPVESRPAESKPAESKPAESKAAESKPAEDKQAESKPAENKPADAAASVTP